MSKELIKIAEEVQEIKGLLEKMAAKDELPTELSDTFFDLFHSKNPKDWQKGKALARQMELEKHPDYLETALMGLESYLESDDLEWALKRLLKNEDDAEFDSYSDLDIDDKRADLEFRFTTDYYMDEREGKKLGKELGNQIAQYITKKLGLPAKVGQSFFSIEDSHDMDGSQVILGSEWGEITVYVEIPLKNLF